MKHFALYCICLLLGFCMTSSVSAKVTADEVYEALRENPQGLIDILSQHSSELLNIVQDGAIKRRDKALIEGWKRDLTIPKHINLESSIIRGNPKAPVTIVAFSDFTCPYCQQGAEQIRRLMQEKGNDVRFIFKSYPREEQGVGPLASEYFIAAGFQDPQKAWDLYDLLFKNRGIVQQDGEAALKRLASKAGLNMNRLAADLKSGRPANKIAEDLAEAMRLGVDGTPTFFINNLIIRGTPTTDLLNQAFTLAFDAAKNTTH